MLAKRVVAWLGPGNKDSTVGLSVLEDLGQKIQFNQIYEMKPASTLFEEHWSDMNIELPYNQREILAIREVVKRPWFKRLWVQQEIRMARHGSILMCGSDLIAWDRFCRAIICLRSKLWRTSDSSFNAPSTRTLVNEVFWLVVEQRSTFHLVDIIHYTSHCECLDPRDRIYAILALLNNFNKAIGIQPDYEKSTSQVYLDITLRWIAHFASIDILRSSGLRNTPSKMPTWVPDWTVANETKPFPRRLASGYSNAKVHYTLAGSLKVTGVHLTTAQHAERKGYMDLESLITEIQLLANCGILRGSYIGGGSFLAAYCYTICAADFDDLYLPPQKARPQLQLSMSLILQLAKTRILDNRSQDEVQMLLHSANYFRSHRSFIKTCEGYIGLAPRMAQPGDQVCVLLGGNMPLLLRPAPNLQYQVVGECYIHGLMHGEAVLGPREDPIPRPKI